MQDRDERTHSHVVRDDLVLANVACFGVGAIELKIIKNPRRLRRRTKVQQKRRN